MPDDTNAGVVGVPKETYPGEKRVALVPDLISHYKRAGYRVVIESEAGLAAGYTDDAYRSKGADVKSSRGDIFDSADVIMQVRGYGANPDKGRKDLKQYREKQIVIGHFEPLSEPKLIREIAEKGVTAFAMELVPRITRAQSMDALSSMATVAGYKAVLIAAEALPKMFPMFMTAAGTITPAHVFIIGAGVAGLQAIATAKRLGAIVHAYDIRPAVKEQVQSLGAKFVEMELETGEAEGKGGYAKAMDEEFYRKQRELMTKVVAENDVVITTAAVPGKKAPILVTEEMVKGMRPGSVIVDLAAERGGNCELTKEGETVEAHGVTIFGPVNLPSSAPYHASQMYAKNVLTFLQNMTKEKKITVNTEDEIIRDTMLTRDGKVVNPQVLELLGEKPPQSEERSDG
jgi:NAD(P) transhydrogenase subunit alpha